LIGYAWLIAGVFLVQGCSKKSDLTVLSVLTHAGIGGLVGAGIGALIDLSIGERWKEADMRPPPPVALNVGQDGSVRLAFSIRL